MKPVTFYEADDGEIFPTAELCAAHEAKFKGDIFDFPMQSNDANAKTIGDYFRALLATLWDEGEGFSGKRPFGNSGWMNELYEPLVVAKVVRGTFVEDGDTRYLDECDKEAAYEVIAEAIEKFGR